MVNSGKALGSYATARGRRIVKNKVEREAKAVLCASVKGENGAKEWLKATKEDMHKPLMLILNHTELQYSGRERSDTPVTLVGK